MESVLHVHSELSALLRDLHCNDSHSQKCVARARTMPWSAMGPVSWYQAVSGGLM